jgi:uncharacterized protein (TIGR03437 family)
MKQIPARTGDLMRILGVALLLVPTVCKGQVYSILANLNTTTGSKPKAGLVQGADGNFYGTTSAGGTSNNGTFFKMTPNGAVTVLYNLTPADGSLPSALIQAMDGNFYGTTMNGGPNGYGMCCGTVFRITPSGTFTTLYVFTGATPDGANPESGVIQGTDGNFYGTTFNGGVLGGVVFKMTPTGSLTSLYSFGSAPTDGLNPVGLVQSADGNFYGATYAGGSHSQGTIFKLTLTGELTTLYSFGSSFTDGQYPQAGLVEGSDGNFYGTTQDGGTHSSGTIFKITPAGAYTSLYSLGSGADGEQPQSALIQSVDGSLYGSTNGGCGTVFKISVAGVLSTIHTFCSSSTDGAGPVSSLTQGTDGSLYGTTSQGGTSGIGSSGSGTVFRLQLSGSAPYTCTNTTPPTITSVDSASAYGAFPYFSSGSWLEIKGTNLADPADPRLTVATNPGQWTSADFNSSNAPTSLDGISATVNGKPAYIYYLSTGQLNVQAPEDSATGNVAITVTNCKATSSPVMFQRRASAPGFLAPTNYTANGTQYMVATFQSDGAYVLNTATGAAFGLNSRPAKPGDGIIAYGIGFGDVTPSILPGVIAGATNALVNPVTISFGTTKATVAYAGLAGGFVGLYEFYFTVPPTLGSGDYQIEVTQSGVTVPQTLYLTVQSSTTTPQVQLKSLTLSPTSVASGGTVQGTVTLSAAAPSGGAVVTLGSNSSVATVPAAVSISVGATSATFTMTAGTVSANQTVTITASYGGVSTQATVTVTGSAATSLPPFTQISLNAAFSTATETSTNNSEDIVIVNGGPASVGITFSGPQVYSISGQFVVTANGQTLTLQPSSSDTIQFGPSFTNYNVTAGSIILNLTPQGMLVSGSFTGTFSLTTSFATVTGTISGTYSGY